MVATILALCAASFMLGLACGLLMGARPIRGSARGTMDGSQAMSMSKSSELSKPQTPTEFNQWRAP
jgi:hypothetical protein